MAVQASLIMTPKVTFLIPAYNALPHVRHTVASMLSQSHKDFRVLVVDDGSTDGTGEYLDSIRDSRFRIVHQENAGYVNALNTGAAMIETDYIARLDADDLAMPDRLEKQVDFLDRNPQVAVVGSRIGYIFLENRRFSIPLGLSRLSPGFSPPMRKCPFWNPIQDGQTIAHPSATLRRAAFVSVGGYRVIPPAEDIDLWIRLHEAGYLLACLPDVLCLYRIVPTSESGRSYARQLQITKYARDCHHLRSSGFAVPTFEDYASENPLNDEELAGGQVALRLRSAMGNLLAGKFFTGGGQIVSLIAREPGHFLRKLRSRI